MKIMRNLLILCLAILLVTAMFGCSTDAELKISADKTTVKPGEAVTLSACIGDKEAKDVTFEITEGKALATLSGNVLTVNADTPDNSVISVVAKSDDNVSETLTVKVDVPLNTIVISAGGATNLQSGSSVVLKKTLDAAAALDPVTWVITEGETLCAIANDVLVVNANAATGSVIKVKAVSGTVESNELSFTVGYPLQKLEAQILGSANVEAGSSRGLAAALTPANATNADVKWVLTEGETLATVTNNILTVNTGAPVGSRIALKAVSGSIESNVLTLIVGVPITDIEISAIGSTTVVKGNTVSMSSTVTPANASAVGIEWLIVEGADYATITDKTLVVKSTAPTNATIKVKARSGSVESNVITFTVAATQEEINATRYLMSFEEDKLTLDKNGTSTPTLSLGIYNYNFMPVNGLAVDYQILSGAQFLSITPNGYSCTLTPTGHGEAQVKATIRGTEVSTVATVKVIVPPTAITLPEVFRERPGFSYSFSRVDALDFVAAANGQNSCQDIVYTFAQQGNSGSVATYANGKITFLTTGEVTLTASSNSGSRVETTATYKFNINDGYNVSTFEALRDLANDPAYRGDKPINLVVLQKPDGTANGYQYGYDLVPAVALKAKATQTFDEVISLSNRIAFTNKGVILNGNGHKIDASQLRIPTGDEINSYNASGASWSVHPYVLGIEPYSATDVTAHNTYSVSMNNLEVVANCPITLDANTSSPAGVYKIGILVGSYHESFTANYYLTMENVNVSAANVGMRLLHIIDGRVKNTFVNNCFSNGMEVAGSIITLEDMVYGACGATGIELAVDHSNMAGVNRNQNQQVTYAGTVTTQFYNNCDTEYLSHYKIAGAYDVPYIINSSFSNSALNDHQIAHLKNESADPAQNGYVFVTFMFHNPGVAMNNSQLIYPGFQAGGIINAKDLPKDGTFDTTHEYIELDLHLLGMDGGKAYFYNVKYQAPAN